MDDRSRPGRLDSWKQIAAHLNVTVRTAQRWEQNEALPVRRHRHAALSSVFAYPAELDAWWESRSVSERKPLAPGARRSLAVLPFENLTRLPADEILSDGLTEEVIASLARIEGLQVIARTSVFHFKGKAADVRSLGGQLGVTSVLEGSVRRSGDRVRITVQLIDAADGAHLWSERYDRGSGDILDLQEEIARAIAEALRFRFSTDSPSPLHRHDAQAYETYLEGRYHSSRRTPTGLLQGIRCFEEAIARDPHLAPAWGALAFNYLLRELWAGGDHHRALDEARRAAREALRLDPCSAEGSIALGTVSALLDYDWTAGESHFRHGLAANPQHAGLHLFYSAQILAPLGRFTEAELHTLHACELDPFSAVPAAALGIHFVFTRRPDRAEIACSRALELDPAYPWAHWALGHVRLQQGRFDAARDEFLKVPAVLGGGLVGYCFARSGCSDQTRRLLCTFEDSETSDRLSLSYQAAILHLGLGDPDRAIARLERARAQRSLCVQWVAVDPVWDAIRDDSRFAILLQSMNIPGQSLSPVTTVSATSTRARA